MTSLANPMTRAIERERVREADAQAYNSSRKHDVAFGRRFSLMDVAEGTVRVIEPQELLRRLLQRKRSAA